MSKDLKSGKHHYMMQRISAIILIPVSIWLVFFATKLVGIASINEFKEYVSDPLCLTIAVIFIITFLYHGMLGIQEVFTDYVKSPAIRKFCNISLLVFVFISIITAIITLIYFSTIIRISPTC